MNVKDGRGKVKDYIAYFQLLAHDREQARAEGLLNTWVGRSAYEIATSGGESLLTAHKNGAIGDEAAVAIAQNAPGNDKLQDLGVRLVMKGRTIILAVDTRCLCGEVPAPRRLRPLLEGPYCVRLLLLPEPIPLVQNPQGAHRHNVRLRRNCIAPWPVAPGRCR